MNQAVDKVNSFLSLQKDCSCGKHHSIETLIAEIGPGASGLTAQVSKKAGLSGKALVVADANTLTAAGEKALASLRSADIPYQLVILEKKGVRRLHADDELVSEVEQSIKPETGFCIAIGGGTINDVVKLGSFRRNKKYMVVSTAASMNGYTSAIAAIDVKGIKRTLSCGQPIAVVGDVDVLAKAPIEMNSAGVGDLMSKPVCNADWKLSHIIRGEFFCSLPGDIVGTAVNEVANVAKGIKAGDKDAVITLYCALLLSGFSMKTAGSSAPASGGEHLVSHFWDMRAMEKGREMELHGAQVGVSTLMMSHLYQEVKNNWKKLISGASAQKDRFSSVTSSFGVFYGSLKGEVEIEYGKKFQSIDDVRGDIEAAKRLSPEIEKEVFPPLITPDEIRKVLLEAGAPTKISEIGKSKEEALEALIHGREIRGRYTILDLAWELGVLPEKAGEVLKEVM